jgi:hypothetical protein
MPLQKCEVYKQPQMATVPMKRRVSNQEVSTHLTAVPLVTKLPTTESDSSLMIHHASFSPVSSESHSALESL